MRRIVSLSIAATLLFVSGCAAVYTQDPIEKGSMLRNGMSKTAVQNLLGDPSKSEIAGQFTAWHYCKTGYGVDDFLVVFFEGERLLCSAIIPEALFFSAFDNE